MNEHNEKRALDRMGNLEEIIRTSIFFAKGLDYLLLLLLSVAIISLKHALLVNMEWERRVIISDKPPQTQRHAGLVSTTLSELGNDRLVVN